MTTRTITFDDERSPADYAIEHAEYLAKAAERFIEAVVAMAVADYEHEGTAEDEARVDAASEAVGEAQGALRNCIYEFRKRRDRAAAPEPPAQQPMQHGMAVRQLGIVGKAFDTPDVRRAYTYSDQPDNVVAMRLGKIASISPVSGGDFINYGLQLLQRLQDAGFGVFELDGIGKGESNAD